MYDNQWIGQNQVPMSESAYPAALGSHPGFQPIEDVPVKPMYSHYS